MWSRSGVSFQNTPFEVVRKETTVWTTLLQEEGHTLMQTHLLDTSESYAIRTLGLPTSRCWLLQHIFKFLCILLHRPPQPNTGGTYRWECFNPIASRELLRYPILTEPLFEGANSIRHLELVYYRNCHYNSIVSIHTGVLHVSPPS